MDIVPERGLEELLAETVTEKSTYAFSPVNLPPALPDIHGAETDVVPETIPEEGPIKIDADLFPPDAGKSKEVVVAALEATGLSRSNPVDKTAVLMVLRSNA